MVPFQISQDQIKGVIKFFIFIDHSVHRNNIFVKGFMKYRVFPLIFDPSFSIMNACPFYDVRSLVILLRSHAY